MSRVAFADESGTDGKTACYAIGVLSVDEAVLAGFDRTYRVLCKRHGLIGEAKWKKVDRGHGLINFALDWLYKILWSRTALLDVIVVNTSQYENWRRRGADKEVAFYKTYTQLLRHVVARAKETTTVYIDDRSDSYDKHHEAMETIGNYMLARLETTGRLKDVQKACSRDMPGIQVADLLTGAIATSHRLYLDQSAPANSGKRLAIERLATLLGWDALHYDTYPDSRINIWHFPSPYRAIPGTRAVQAAHAVPYVSESDMDRLIEREDRRHAAR